MCFKGGVEELAILQLGSVVVGFIFTVDAQGKKECAKLKGRRIYLPVDSLTTSNTFISSLLLHVMVNFFSIVCF